MMLPQDFFDRPISVSDYVMYHSQLYTVVDATKDQVYLRYATEHIDGQRLQRPKKVLASQVCLIEHSLAWGHINKVEKLYQPTLRWPPAQSPFKDGETVVLKTGERGIATDDGWGNVAYLRDDGIVYIHFLPDNAIDLDCTRSLPITDFVGF